METYHCSVCDAAILTGGITLRKNDLDNSGMIDSWKPILVLLIVHLSLLSWASGGGAEILWWATQSFTSICSQSWKCVHLLSRRQHWELQATLGELKEQRWLFSPFPSHWEEIQCRQLGLIPTFYFIYLLPLLVVLRSYCWFCAQESLLTVLMGPHGIRGTERELARQGKYYRSDLVAVTASG